MTKWISRQGTPSARLNSRRRRPLDAGSHDLNTRPRLSRRCQDDAFTATSKRLLPQRGPVVSKPNTSSPRTMTVTQTAVVLGISRTTAYECVRAESIPSLHLGGRILIPIQAIDETLERACVVPHTQAPSDPAISIDQRRSRHIARSDSIQSSAGRRIRASTMIPHTVRSHAR